MTLADKEFTSKRNRVKRIRTVFEIIVIVVLHMSSSMPFSCLPNINRSH